jgi:hypothetical protein
LRRIDAFIIDKRSEGGEKTPTTIKEMKLTTPLKQYH